MKCAIWGANESGIWFQEFVKKLPVLDCEIICFGDNSDEKQNTIVNGLKVFDISIVKMMFEKDEIDSVIIATSNKHVDSIAQQLSNIGIQSIYMVPPYVSSKRQDELKLEEVIIRVDTNKPRMKYFEYHVVDHCNLNCKGCGHFCNLVTEPAFGDLVQFERDLNRLKELVWGIERIRLMGGEPLLNPQLSQFAIKSREVFPDASIHIVTNGLLINRMEDELFCAMRNYNIVFDISRYEPTEKKLDRIKELCEREGVTYNIANESIHEFTKSLDLSGENNVIESHEACMSKHCAFLRDGKISVCGMPMLIDKFIKRYEVDMAIADEDLIDIYEVADGWKLVDSLANPISMCKYCSPTPQLFEWKKAGYEVDIYDWVIDD